MKRTAVAALAAVTALALPAAPANACSPSFGSLTAPARAAAGEEVRLKGEARVNWCPEPTTGGTVTVTARPEPEPTRSGLPIPGVTLPPLLPVAYAAPVRAEVAVTLASFDGTERGPERTIAVVLADPAEPRASRHSFTATVRIPADVTAGRYLIEARHRRDGVVFGERELTVTAAGRNLAATGGHARDLLALGLLAIAAGAGTLVAARRAS